MKSLFTTKNRRLEQFLFVHDIHFLTWSKDIDGMTEWARCKTRQQKKTRQGALKGYPNLVFSLKINV